MASRTNRRRAAGIIKRLIDSESLYLISWVIWFLLLWWLSSGKLPNEPTPDFPFKDKVMHWGYFGIGGALLTFYTLSSTQTERIRPPVFLSLLVLGIGVGMIDEIHQSWDLNRSGKDLGDLLADTLGIISGLMAAQYLWKKRSYLTC